MHRCVGTHRGQRTSQNLLEMELPRLVSCWTWEQSVDLTAEPSLWPYHYALNDIFLEEKADMKAQESHILFLHRLGTQFRINASKLCSAKRQ